MDQHLYQRVKKKFGKVGSWAIWDSKPFRKKDDLEELMDAHVEKLNPRIILCGLNKNSEDKHLDDRIWHNFHVKGKDRWVMEVFAQKETEGAYMTDILKTPTVSREGRIDFAVLDLHKEFGSFAEELKLLGEKKYKIIAFGETANRYLCQFAWSKECKRHSDLYEIEKIVLCVHYSARMKKDEWFESAKQIRRSL